MGVCLKMDAELILLGYAYECSKCGDPFKTKKELHIHYYHIHGYEKKPNVFTFKGKKVKATEPVRVGICSNCGFKGYTHLHHDDYDESNPLLNTRELCPKCHGIETEKQRQAKINGVEYF